jgi:hypothetical protein
MRSRNLPLATLAFLLSYVSASPVLAQAQATRIGSSLDDVVSFFEELTTLSDCLLGELGPPAASVTSVVFPGAPHFAIGFVPRALCANCNEGFRIHTIHVVGEVPYPTTIRPFVQFMESVNMSGCPWPPNDENDAICRNTASEIPIAQAGFYDPALSMDCDCAWSSYRYFLTFWPGGLHRILVDDAPAVCHDLVNIGFGLGWFDPGFSGDILIYAEADCCENPIPVERSSWGTIKALFGS